VKRFATVAIAAHQAGRQLDPLTGQALEAECAIDPRLLPRLDRPISPALQMAISSAISEAIAANVSLPETCDRVVDVLEAHGIVLSRDDLRSLVGSHVLSVS
jgi:hypothetical protein